MITYYFVYNSLDIDINQISYNFTVSNAEISQTCHGTIYKRLWMILQQLHWLETPLLKWSASTAQLSRRMLTIEGGSSIFGAKDFQQRFTILWIFKFAPLLIPIIYTQIYYINYYLISVISFRNDNCNKMQTRQISNQWKWFGWVASWCSGCSWNERISSSFCLSYLYTFNTPLLR